MNPEQEQNNNSLNPFLLIKTEVDKFIESLKNGNPNTSDYMNIYSEVYKFAEKGNSECTKLCNLYSAKVQNYIRDCKKKLEEESKTNLIDGILMHTKNINILIFWLTKAFSYLDLYYMKAKKHLTLSKLGLEIYEEEIYNCFNIKNELNNMKSDEKSGNEESSDKIKNLMQISEYLKFERPKIIRENGEIKWINEVKK